MLEPFLSDDNYLPKIDWEYDLVTPPSIIHYLSDDDILDIIDCPLRLLVIPVMHKQ